jgi:hypothetical protein
MNANRISPITLGAALVVASLGNFNVQAADQPATASAVSNKYAQSPRLTPGLEEVVKLIKAGVSEPVTIAYIKNSTRSFSMDAQDILLLQGKGVSPQVLTAMIQHSDELRRATGEASQPVQPNAPATTGYQSPSSVITAPAQAPVQYVTAPSAPASSVSVTYIGYPRYSYATGYRGYRGYYGYPVYGAGSYPGYYSCAPRYYSYGGVWVGSGMGYGGVYHGGYDRGYHGGYVR